MINNENKIIFLTCMFSTISFFLIDFYLASFPSMTHYFSSNKSTTQMMVSFYLIGISVSQLIYGALSDRYGRKSVLLIGISIGFIANTLIIFAETMNQILVLRLISGLGAGACPAIARAVLGDKFEGGKLLKSNSYLSMSITMSPAIAPLIGGIIQETLGWKASFLMVSLWCVLVVFFIFYFFQETHPEGKRTSISVSALKKIYVTLLTDCDFLTSAFISCLAISAGLIYYIMTPYIFQNQLNISPVYNGSIYILNALANLGGAYYVSYRSQRITSEELLGLGIKIALCGSLLMVICGLTTLTNIFSIVLPMLIISFSFGIIMPSTGTIAIRKFRSVGGSCAAGLGFFRMGGSALITFMVISLKFNSQLFLSIVLFLLFISAIISYKARDYIVAMQVKK